ncbi:MAG TPA: septal ring lytic transglycosylase RlpA family protein [Burkholderiales bacterium]
MKRLLWLLLVAGCAGAPPRESPLPETSRPGGYYKDDGPHERVPDNLAAIPDAQPRVEPLSRFANRPYEVFGKRYVPLVEVQPFRQRGMASWYGKRFHGQRTSSGEPYDMYAMSAAHPTLPIPSYARVTRVATGRSVVVRINDRGPFHAGRIIDLSYAAAARLGIVQIGSAEVEVEAIVPGEERSAQAHGAEAAIFLQVGAFASRDNAERLRARLASLQDPSELLLVGELWRLQLGPYRSREEARSAAERLERAFALKPFVVVR